MKTHTTKDGKKIRLCDLELSHLMNIIRMIERKAVTGLKVVSGGGGWDADDMWYDEDVYYGKEALDLLNYNDYKAELKRRNINLPH